MSWLHCIDWSASLMLLAQAAPEGGAPEVAEGAKAQPDSFAQFFLSPFNFMLILFIAFFFIVLWPQQRQMRQQQKALQDALSNLKKNDRVITSGGIHGTVLQNSADSGTVTLRIDDSTGAKLTVSREAIVRVVNPDTKSSETKSA